MSYEQCVARALALSPPSDSAPANVQAAWTRLQARLTEYEESNVLSHSVEGESVSREGETSAGRRVCTYLSAYLTVLGEADLAPAPGVSRPRIGHTFDFSTREVRA